MSLSVVVGYVSPGFVTTEFHDSLMHLILENGIGGRISVQSGPRIATSRNTIVREFLTTNREWLWMLDTDMVFGSDTLQKLLDADREIVGALCHGFNKDGESFPVMHEFTETGMRRIASYPDNELVEVDATGAACLLVHRDVLAKMEANADNDLYPWFQEGRTLGGLEVGEDVCFCLKAKEQGYQIYVHTGIKCGHKKSVVIGG